MENTKKAKKRVRTKGQKIRSIIMMALLCIAMLSGATYAWFTLSNTARVTNMQLTVGDVTGLQIAPDISGSAGTFSATYDLNKDNAGIFKGKLLPATTINGKDFLKPVYDDDGKVCNTSSEGVNKFDSSSTETNKEGYYCEIPFWLKSLGTNVTVSLKAGSEYDADDNLIKPEGAKGTYILNQTGTANDNKVKGAAAIRVSLTVCDGADNAEGNTVLVYEPNSDYSTAGVTKAEDKRDNKNVVTSNVKQNQDGSFTGTPATFDLTKDKATKIIMRVWLEGTDLQCANEIALSNLVGQIQFESKEKTNQ